MATNPLGTGSLGQVRIGDKSMAGVLPRSTALGLTFTVSESKYNLPLGLTYTAQANNVAILQLYFLATPPQGFSINGDTTIVTPDQVTIAPRPVVGRTLFANPLLQGYQIMTWTYTLLQQAEAQHLISFYNPASPQVTLVYINDEGTWVQRRATMVPPNLGNLETVAVEGFALQFLLLPG